MFPGNKDGFKRSGKFFLMSPYPDVRKIINIPDKHFSYMKLFPGTSLSIIPTTRKYRVARIFYIQKAMGVLCGRAGFFCNAESLGPLNLAFTKNPYSVILNAKYGNANRAFVLVVDTWKYIVKDGTT